MLGCDESQSFFWTPFDTLRTIRLVFAAVACKYDLLFRVHHHRSELAGAYAPCAAVACLFINCYRSVFFLVQGISWASRDAGRVFTVSARYCEVVEWP